MHTPPPLTLRCLQQNSKFTVLERLRAAPSSSVTELLFCFGERHTWLGPVGRLVFQVAKIPSSTSCCLAVRGVPVCRQPIKCVKTVSVTVIYMSQSNPRTTEKPIQLNRSAVTRSPLSSPCGRSHHPGTGGNPGNQHLPQKTLRARRRLLEMVSPNHSSDKENKTWH